MFGLLSPANLLLAFSVVLLLALAFIISAHSKNKKADKLFVLFILSATAWVLTNLIANLILSSNAETYLFWTKVTLFGPLLVPFLLILFADTFPGDKISLPISLVVILGLVTLISLVLVPTNLYISSVETVNGTFNPGPLFIPFIFFLFFGFIASFYIFFKKYRRSSGIEKLQIKTILFGLTASIIFGAVANGILPLFGSAELISIGPVSILFLILSTAYAILKHKLLNVRLIATEIVVYMALIILGAELIFSKSPVEIIFRLLFLFIAAYGGWMLIRSMRLEISRREEIEKLSEEKTQTLTELEARNKNLATLQKISQLVLNEFELRPMAQRILDEIPKQLDNCIGALLSLTQQSNLTAFSFSANSFSRKIYSLVGSDLEKYSYPLQVGFNKMHDALLANKMLESEKLQDFVSPPIPKSIATTIQTLLGMRHIVALPLYAGGQPLGVMLFVYRQTKNELGTKDVEMAQAIADDMSLAIQRAEAYQKLKDANEYLSQLDKMKDEFISMASHELNTPLAAIEGYLSMILDEGMGKVDAKSKVFLTRAYDSSKRLAELILDLLNVSRIEQGRLKMKFSQCQLVDLAESVIHELQIKADSKKIYLKLDADKKKVPPLWCDPDRIREVYVNLVGNALKFTEKGGVTIKITKVGDHIHSEVIDTGRGIAKIDQKKLFQKFSQVKREVDEHQGTGLGLYISKNFLELHHGKLSVESDEGKGANFMFDLPMLEAPPKQVEGAILEQSISAPRVEVGPKEVPGIIARSSDRLNS